MLRLWARNNLLRPSLDLDFLNATSLDSRITFTRGSTATFFNSAGVLSTASNNVPRLDYDPATLQPRGLLIEEQRTNSIRNNTMQGAVAGTPGTVPTNWTSNVAVGLTQEIVGIGTENGITYIDWKLSGTATATSQIAFESTTQIVAAASQAWTATSYVRLVAGSLTNVSSLQMCIREGTAAGVFVRDETANFTPTSATLNTQRASVLITSTNASTARVMPRIFANTAGAVDFTLRIGLPQLELGAFATSVIPTTTTALTRSADVASMTGTNFSSWFNAAGGTVVTNFAFVGLRSVAGQRIITFDDESNTNLLSQTAQSNNTLVTSITDAGSAQMASTSPATTFAANTAYKMGFAYALNDSVAAINGTAGTVDTSCTIPTSITTFRLAASSAAPTSNCWYSRISFYPVRLANATLVALTS